MYVENCKNSADFGSESTFYMSLDLLQEIPCPIVCVCVCPFLGQKCINHRQIFVYGINQLCVHIVCHMLCHTVSLHILNTS
jgi:hypothetical protein